MQNLPKYIKAINNLHHKHIKGEAHYARGVLTKYSEYQRFLQLLYNDIQTDNDMAMATLSFFRKKK